MSVGSLGAQASRSQWRPSDNPWNCEKLNREQSRRIRKRVRSARSWRFYALGVGETPGRQPEATAASIVLRASSLRCIAERCFEVSQGIHPLDHEVVNPTASR